MLLMMTSSAIILFIIVATLISFPLKAGRFDSLKSYASSTLLHLVTSKVAKMVLVSLFIFLAYSNVLGNIPGNYTPTQFYSVVMSLSLSFWTPILICATVTDFKGFFAHMFPKGAPLWMIILLPIVEFISIMLRPLILVVRLATNLAAGHILLFIFSYFASLLPASSPLLGGLLAALYVMEFFISILQAYIFTTLLSLYVEDTLPH